MVIERPQFFRQQIVENPGVLADRHVRFSILQADVEDRVTNSLSVRASRALNLLYLNYRTL